MRVLGFSDVHTDLAACRRLLELSDGADLVVGAGDFASVHDGLAPTLEALAPITTPTVLVPGNNETEDALRSAAAGWPAATVLHGQEATVAGVTVFGLGAGIPTTPWDWSFDLDEEAAADRLEGLGEGSLLVLHSPPHGHCDQSSSGDHLGSSAIADAITERKPALAVCGHIHESWGQRSRIGGCEIANLGPEGAFFEL